MHVCVCMCLCMYVRVCVCVHVHIVFTKTTKKDTKVKDYLFIFILFPTFSSQAGNSNSTKMTNVMNLSNDVHLYGNFHCYKCLLTVSHTLNSHSL